MRRYLLTFGLPFLLAGMVFAQDEDPVAEQMEEAEPTIVELAAADGRFGTLVSALEATDLVSTLQGNGPFTVFAPTDDAFGAIPADTLTHLLENDLERLRLILLAHVIQGEVPASGVAGLTQVNTIAGSFLVGASEAGVTVGAANVIQADIVASNGLIHVIDTVLLE